MATGLMGYTNTTPTGMEGVGGNAPKQAVVPPTMDNMNEGRAPMGEEMTDGGMTADQTGGLLSSQEDMAIASTFSTEQKELAKRIYCINTKSRGCNVTTRKSSCTNGYKRSRQ